MTTTIHPTAVVDPAASLGEGVEIGPYAVVQGPAVLGDGTQLMAHATVLGHTRLGSENVLYPGCVLGADPQDLKHRGEVTHLEVGDRNRFREHVTVHAGTVKGGGLTRVGSDGLFMAGCHVAHDAEVGDRVILANHVLLAGHVRVEDGAILNGAAACHHFTTVGRLAYVGGLSRITQDVPPFSIVEGHPARIRGCNVVGLRRAGVAEDAVLRVRDAIRSIYLSRSTTAAAAMRALEAEHPEDPLIAEVLGFIRAAGAGRQGRAREVPR